MIPAITAILEQEIGLDSSSVGVSTISRAVAQRIKHSGAKDTDTYLAQLNSSHVELQALIDEVTVPETWFFRDLVPFRLLAEIVARDWLPTAAQGKTLRILSVPCSSGEEAYSIAMTLHDAGLPPPNFCIDAIDVNTRSLERARVGIYGKNSFRGDESHFRERYFHQSGTRYELNPDIRNSVNFLHGNLLDGDLLRGAERYDVIFCRNLLIYFNRDKQAQVLKKLHTLLVPDGLLFLGHAEAGCIDNQFFSSVRRARAFAFRKADGAKPRVAAAKQPVPIPVPAPRTAVQPKPRVRRAPAVPKEAASKVIASPSAPELEQWLQEAQHLADQGKLAEAASRCKNYLEHHAGSADAYYLLGIVRTAEGDHAQAGQLFRKAVYLDPRHYQALIHLAIHAEQQGDAAVAAKFRARAERANGGKA
jgi:chemotaxis protein methyltransferase WspC